MIPTSKSLRLALALAVSGLMVWALSTQFNLRFFQDTLRHADPIPLLWGLPLAALVALIRGIRFRAAAPVAPILTMTAIMGLKNGVARVTPFRLGELYTLHLLRRHGGVPAQKTLLLIVWIKLVDLAVLVSIFLLGLSSLVFDGGPSSLDPSSSALAAQGSRLTLWAALALGLLLALVYGFGFWIRVALAPINRLVGPAGSAAPGWRGRLGKLSSALAQVSAELSDLSVARVSTVLACTVLLWAVQLGIVSLLLLAFGVHLPISAVALGFGATQMALVLPLPSVASVGPLEAGWFAGFTAVGVPPDLAAVTGLAANGVLLAYALLVAGVCWLVLRGRGAPQ